MEDGIQPPQKWRYLAALEALEGAHLGVEVLFDQERVFVGEEVELVANLEFAADGAWQPRNGRYKTKQFRLRDHTPPSCPLMNQQTSELSKMTSKRWAVDTHPPSTIGCLKQSHSSLTTSHNIRSFGTFIAPSQMITPI